MSDKNGFNFDAEIKKINTTNIGGILKGGPEGKNQEKVPENKSAEIIPIAKMSEKDIAEMLAKVDLEKVHISEEEKNKIFLAADISKESLAKNRISESIKNFKEGVMNELETRKQLERIIRKYSQLGATIKIELDNAIDEIEGILIETKNDSGLLFKLDGLYAIRRFFFKTK